MILDLITVLSTFGSIYFLIHGLVLMCMANKYEDDLESFKNEMTERYSSIDIEELTDEVVIEVIRRTKDKGLCEVCISFLLIVVLFLI